MSFSKKTAALAAVLALSAAPAFAIPSNSGTSHVPDNQGTAHMPTTPTPAATPATPVTPGPNASAAAKGKAYGKYCQGQSKKHVDGQKGTPFSQCVTAMAKLATGKTDNPTTACKTMSKKHVKGEKGTPFSRCVSAAAKLKAAQDQPAS
jgi:hypothetical protein